MHLSIAVPSTCGNKCKFCIANMQRDTYQNPRSMFITPPSVVRQDYLDRMAYAKEAGCTSVTLTGEGEPLMNQEFLECIGQINSSLPSPFYHVQLQTSGMMLNIPTLEFLRDCVGVTGISLSLCHFNSDLNASCTRPQKPEYKIDVEALCCAIVNAGFTLRVCLNLTDLLRTWQPEEILLEAKRLGASQVTFRELFSSSDSECGENMWIAEHKASETFVMHLRDYINLHGSVLPDLGTGLNRRSLFGMSVVLDSDCMSTSHRDAPRTMIIREDRRLYSRWDDKGSLIF